MKLKWMKPSGLDKNLKATVHKSGKLGFTMEAANKLNLSVDKTASIAVNEEDEFDENLYVLIHDGSEQEDVYKINKAGEYYYINAKALFDTLKIDYVEDSVVFDISKKIIEGQEGYIFKRRYKKKKINTD